MNTDELNFAYKVRHALDEDIDRLPASVTKSLASGRKLAISRKKKDSPLALFVPAQQIAGQFGSVVGAPVSWLARMGFAIPLVVLALGLAGIYQYEHERRISDTAELDVAVLTDDLPLSAYLDYGFNAYLAERDD